MPRSVLEAARASVEFASTAALASCLAAHLLLVAFWATDGMAVPSSAVCHDMAPFEGFTRPASKYTIKNIEASSPFEK